MVVKAVLSHPEEGVEGVRESGVAVRAAASLGQPARSYRDTCRRKPFKHGSQALFEFPDTESQTLFANSVYFQDEYPDGGLRRSYAPYTGHSTDKEGVHIRPRSALEHIPR